MGASVTHKTVQQGFDQFDLGAVREIQPIRGGSINTCLKVATAEQSFFVKVRKPGLPKDLYEKEVEGLNALRAASGVKVPEVIAMNTNVLVLEYLERDVGVTSMGSQDGAALAAVHQIQSDHWGWDTENYIGALKQRNAPKTDGPAFFVKRRIMPLVDRVPALEDIELDRKKMRRWMEDNLPKAEPVLLHGDLWSGNIFRCADGSTALYDPAVYYGHHQIDLAMTELFGGFGADFYEGYREAADVTLPDRDAVRFWNLYPLLVHAVLFGGTYRSDVRTTLAYFGFIDK